MRNLSKFKIIFSVGFLALLMGGLPLAAAAKSDKLIQCRLTDAQLASPAAMWDWAMSKPPGPNAPDGEGHHIIGAIHYYHGLNAIKPYVGTAAMDRYTECYEKGGTCGFKISSKVAKNLKKGKFSSKHLHRLDSFKPHAYSQRLTGYCKKRPQIVYSDVREAGFTPGNFAPSQCKAFTNIGPDKSWTKKDQKAFRHWRADYERRGPEPDGRCIYLPTILATRPEVAAASKGLDDIYRAKMDAKAEEKAQAYCFPGVSQNASRKTLVDMVYRRSADPRYETVIDEAVGRLDPGDGRINTDTVGSAFALYGYYRAGPENLVSDSVLLGKLGRCLRSEKTDSRIDCGITPRPDLASQLLRWTTTKYAKYSAILREGIPDTMTAETQKFLKQNLGTCAVSSKNLSEVKIEQRKDKYGPWPIENCQMLASYIRSLPVQRPGQSTYSSGRRQVLADTIDIAWLRNWDRKVSTGNPQCVTDYPRSTFRAMELDNATASQDRIREAAAEAERERWRNYTPPSYPTDQYISAAPNGTPSETISSSDAYTAARERGVTNCQNTGGTNCD